MNSKQLSKRLQWIADSIIKYAPKPTRLADIGSDHAYLPSYLAQGNYIEFAIAGEVVKGPYQSAIQEVNQHQLNDRIDVRLGDGYDVIHFEDKINTVSICGMGGGLIVDILTRGQQTGHQPKLLALQPNVGERIVRQWLNDHHYQIIDEYIIQEKGHFYEMIIAQSNPNTKVTISDKELMFGPFLLQERNDTFIEKWRNELEKTKYILTSLQLSKKGDHTKELEVKQTIKAIEEVIS